MSDGKEPIVHLDFDSARIPSGQRFDAWQRALVSFDLSRREAAPFAATARVWMLGPLIVTRASVDPLRYDRSPHRIASDANDHFALVYLLSGTFEGDYGAGPMVSRKGSLTVLDMRRPYWTDAARLDAFILSMARDQIAPHLERFDPHGLVTDRGAAGLLGAMLEQFAAAIDGLTRHHAPMLSTIVRDLVVRTIIDGATDGDDALVTTRNDGVMARGRRHIDANLSGNLSSSAICAAIGVSRSALYRAFDDVGGVQQEVQRRRLRRLRGSLADPAEIRSIARMAASFGFADASHATRLFKRTYGRTPGDYRKARLSHRELTFDDDIADAPSIFDRWVRLLD